MRKRIVVKEGYIEEYPVTDANLVRGEPYPRGTFVKIFPPVVRWVEVEDWSSKKEKELVRRLRKRCKA